MVCFVLPVNSHVGNGDKLNIHSGYRLDHFVVRRSSAAPSSRKRTFLKLNSLTFPLVGLVPLHRYRSASSSRSRAARS